MKLLVLICRTTLSYSRSLIYTQTKQIQAERGIWREFNEGIIQTSSRLFALRLLQWSKFVWEFGDQQSTRRQGPFYVLISQDLNGERNSVSSLMFQSVHHIKAAETGPMGRPGSCCSQTLLQRRTSCRPNSWFCAVVSYSELNWRNWTGSLMFLFKYKDGKQRVFRF